jgi:uncharacterized protein YbbC (DUF1343 family)
MQMPRAAVPGPAFPVTPAVPEKRGGTGPAGAAPVKPGVEVLCEKHLDLLRGRRVGLITNPTGVDSRLCSTIALFREHPDIRLAALYGPEHGVRGDAQAGEYVGFERDPHRGIPVFSLYGQDHARPADLLERIDEHMRSFDTQPAGKTIDPEMLRAVDILVFDLQDVGTRVYTYVATMAHAMAAAAEAGIPFVVLDRPNPINGTTMEGPVLEYPAYRSFIGMYPIPLRHGMTAGELARLFNAAFLPRPVELMVVPAESWRRDLWLDGTGLPWVLPSPNLPTLDSATVYPGQVMLEGTNLSEGRGTTRPFELFGASWIDGYELARALNATGLPGVVFREAWFTPRFSKFAGQRCGGCQLHLTDRDRYQPVATAITLLATVKERYEKQFAFHEAYFDHVLGTAAVRRALERGGAPVEILQSFEPGLAGFAARRKPFLLYPAGESA